MRVTRKTVGFAGVGVGVAFFVTFGFAAGFFEAKAGIDVSERASAEIAANAKLFRIDFFILPPLG